MKRTFLSLWITCLCVALLPLHAQNRGITISRLSSPSKALVEKSAYGCLVTTNSVSTPMGPMEFSSPQMGYISLEKPFSIKQYITATPWQASPIAGAAANGRYYGYMCMEFYGNIIPATLSNLNLNDSAREEVVAFYNIGMDYFYHDMTYDYSTNTMYAIAATANSSTGANFLFSVNLSDGSFKNIGDLGNRFISLACSYDGYMFAVSTDGNLYSINKAKASATLVGSTGIMPSGKFQSMEFDHSSNLLYWAANNKTDKKNHFVQLDYLTGKALSNDTIIDNMRITGMYIPYTLAKKDAPNAISNLIIRADTNSAKFTWTNPSICMDSTALSTLTKIEIYRNDQLVHTINAPVVGGQESWTHSNLPIGNAYYKIVAYNSVGKGLTKMIKVWIGLDIPSAAAQVVLTKEKKIAKLAWSAPTIGENGGAIDLKTLNYTIKRNPFPQTWKNIKTTTFNDTTITELSNYTYEIIALTKDGEGQSAFSNILLIGDALNNPYYTNFGGAKEFAQWTIDNANKDDKTWSQTTIDDKAFVQYDASATLAADDWLISPPIKLEAGKNYSLKIDIRTLTNNHSESLAISMGKGVNAAAMTMEVMKTKVFKGENPTTERTLFSVATSGEYNFGLHAVSPADQSLLSLTNFAIEEYGEKDFRGYTVEGPQYPTIGKASTYSVKVQNNGSKTQENYVIKLLNKAIMQTPFGSFTIETMVDTLIVKDSLVPDAIYGAPIKWTPTTPGDNQLSAISVLNGDINTKNDMSLDIAIKVQDRGSEYAEILDRSNKNNAIPVAFGPNASAEQTIYLASEIGIKGGIAKELIYSYENLNGKIEERKLKIYMANTSLSNLSDSWIPEANFVLVADTTFTFQRSENHIKIALNNKFVYTGGNLAIMIIAPMDGIFNGNFHSFYGTKDTKAPNRSLAWGGFGEEFNFGQKGVLSNFIPFTQIGFKTKDGVFVQGMVKNTKGKLLKQVKVEIPSLKITTYTNELGKYSFNYVPEAKYTFQASSIGYANYSIDTLNVKGDTIIYDFTMDSLATYRIYGNVKDADGANVADAQVKISGYATFKTTTDVQGNFSITGVYTSQNYTLNLFKSGLTPYTSESFKIENSDKNVGTIKLSDILFPVENVLATTANNSTEITWSEAINKSLFRIDDGSVYSSLGAPQGNEKTVLGVAYKTPAILYNMSWMTIRAEGNLHPLVNIFVFDLDANGKPTSTILFSQHNVANTDSTWTKFKFPTPIEAPHGFMLALSCNKGHLGLANDNSPNNTNWPFVKNANYFSGSYDTLDFQCVESLGFPRNLLVRGEGAITSMPNFIPQKASSQTMVQNSYVNLSESGRSSYVEETINTIQNATKSKKGYKVWRLEEGQEDKPGRWNILTPNALSNTSYIDAEWKNLPQAFYRYAVKAIYSEDYSSEAVISNIVDKNMYTNVTLTVKTNTPVNESEGAKVHLFNNTFSYDTVVNPNGIASFSHMVKGIYTLTIELNGFAKFTVENQDFSTEDSYQKSYTLTETLIKPFNLEVLDTNVANSKVFHWNVSGEISDDFESHTNFALNSTGALGWNYLDGDKLNTYGIKNVSFPNAEEKMAYILFNPNATTPAIADPAFQAHSGSKYLAFFAAVKGTNQDFLISPQLKYSRPFTFSFFAKSLDSVYNETFKVGYSTTGKTVSNFTFLSASPVSASPTWKEYSYTIPAEAQYVCIEYVSNDAFVLLLDDAFIGYKAANAPKAFTKYDVYLDNTKVGQTEETSFLFKDLSNGKHTAGVKAIYTSGESALSTLDFNVGVGTEERIENNLKFYPNPVQDKLYIQGAFSQIIIYDLAGKPIKTISGSTPFINTSMLTNGVYFLKITTPIGVFTHKIIVKQ
ncbi:MAG: carboxypeptidase regulatory-like domain-containing protein [Bacteroidales bacterium]